MNDFIQSFREFLFSEKVVFTEVEEEKLTTFHFTEFDLKVVALPISYFNEERVSEIAVLDLIRMREEGGVKTIFLFEDRWRFNREVVSKRLLAHLGRGGSLFARNCIVSTLPSDMTSSFLDRYHSYGATDYKYSYGLFSKGRGEEPIAVATFSAPRKMNRDGVLLDSYEWIRYASLPDIRVVGGMGKLMQHFIDEVSPQEIMSYSDLEWSEGDVYLKLGFDKVEEKPPISFMVNRLTMERISEQKILRDRKYRSLPNSKEEFIRISNLGSTKYLLRRE